VVELSHMVVHWHCLWSCNKTNIT